jgi:hypothetical protein
MGLYVASCCYPTAFAASFSGTLPRYMRDLGRVAEMRDDDSNSCVISLKFCAVEGDMYLNTKYSELTLSFRSYHKSASY